MRTIKYASKFKRDYKREKSSRHGRDLDRLLGEIVRELAADRPLPHRNFDHSLSGNWVDCRDCHVRPDLVLIYRKIGDDILEFVRLGSHSELGL
jgi:mRNA interferase YafQ